ncbi:hypothetical protein CU669_05795 [Paramagnetospirillum kuznetsovii]|uniref:Uncharacterized protein n=1 Tax=Paramagnetospirillum kuznetsovii TaxID=2053833 RepID=A0A364P0P5_9PROT|nr:tetratricopeptide repeat-containing glycosyltransferase family protein [Paramagnetospirillum kuznetsovii]RAU22894.1 hypothetical protein CU669_05795 [Paramagnetospirillum kuznetsovii]
MDIESELQQGIELQKAGRLGDAVRHYKLVLEVDPANVDALNLMSVLALTAGDFQTAASLAFAAVSEQPDWFVSRVNLGNALQAQGRHDEAIDAFQQAIALNPSSAEAYLNLSDALNQTGRHGEAADMAVQAILIAPEMADAHVNFGNALMGLESPGEALEAYVKAARLDASNALAWMNMGNAHMALGAPDAAVEAYLHSISLSDGPMKRFNLGNAYYALHRFAEAAEAYGKCLELEPNYLDARINLGAVLRDMGRLDDAETTVRDALALAPNEAELHWNLALVQLTRGNYLDGWREYEWRWRTPHFARFVREFNAAEWQGESLDGKTILVHAEQGFGDALEMCRFVPLLADMGATVTLECRPGLGRLFTTLDPRVSVFEVGSQPLPDTDYHVPLMSLPLRFQTTLNSIPSRVPYLRAPDGAATFPDVAAHPGLKVGVAWSGSSTRRDNQPRSFRPHDLLELGDCRLYSLQKGDAAATASDLFDHGLMIDLGPLLGDFADTAAAIGAMDLIVSADTAVAHLAGALGKPVWILLPAPTSAFLWMQGRADSPWYPSARLFRQTTPGDWSSVVAEMHQALAEDILKFSST